MIGSMSSGTAGQITRASKSNLALAFVALPRERRRDMTTFYGFCRVVDDLADEPGLAAAERHAALDRWKASLSAPQTGEPELAAEVRALIEKYRLPVGLFLEIILGCEMDVSGTTYETWDDLRLYCHRVASVVGLVSIEIFGYTDPACRRYAVDLGLALQLTNILRDVGEDFRNGGRVYLPRADMESCGYDASRLALGKEDNAFRSLMELEAARARGFFASARAALPAADRRSMVAAEIMRAVYSRLLDKMTRDGFHIFTRRYRLSRWEKLGCVLRGRFGRV